jgi:hypothetical protein
MGKKDIIEIYMNLIRIIDLDFLIEMFLISIIIYYKKKDSLEIEMNLIIHTKI